MSALVLDFCGERSEVPVERAWYVGRDADLNIDENPFLHRRFLEFYRDRGLWWLGNVGGQIAATLSDPDSLLQAWLAPGSRLPLTLPHTIVSFTAGATSYDLDLFQPGAPYQAASPPETDEAGLTTVGQVTLTPDQLLLVLVLAEPRLLAEGRGPSTLPSAPEAAERLGWTVTKFNRKLDNVCAKLTQIGVRGLHGDTDRLASNRRARLVEYAVCSRLVTRSGLSALPAGVR